jgi:serine/threonine protein kinase
VANRFGDRWEVIESLGEGGQAHTFMVRDLRDGTTGWVLKRLKNPTRQARFEREIRALSRLQSSHVPSIVDFAIGDRSYLVTPYVGRNLVQLRDALEPQTLLERFHGIVVAAADAHAEGLIHRDIKPDNVTVDDAGTPFLVDFGICADDESEVVLTTTAEGFGNRAFAAPECEPGSMDAARPASDVYSLGKLLYWMTTGGRVMVRERFDEEDLNIADPHARSYVAGLIRHTVVENTDQRWTVTELLEGIDWCLAKLSEHDAIARTGLVVVTDGFGPNDECYPNGSRSAKTTIGNPPADYDQAEAFVVADAVTLNRIDLALRLHQGSGRAEVRLVEDLDGNPSEHVIERWEAEVSEQWPFEVVRLHSQTGPRLGPDTTYWLTLSARDANSNIAWVSAALELRPRRVLLSNRDRLHEWRTGESRSGPGLACRVLGYDESDQNAQSGGKGRRGGPSMSRRFGGSLTGLAQEGGA